VLIPRTRMAANGETVRRNKTNGEISTVSAIVDPPPISDDEQKTDYRFLFVRVVICAIVLALIVAMIVVTITGEINYEKGKTVQFDGTTVATTVS